MNIIIQLIVSLFVTGWLSLSVSSTSQAYDVEANSFDNTIYLLLKNPTSNAPFSSIDLSIQSPPFINAASATFIPSSIDSNRSDLLALTFDVYNDIALASNGNMVITVNGIISGQWVSFPVTVPLTVVNSSQAAQGEIGSGPPPTNGDPADTDGDGISDALETAFGSDANNNESFPGGPIIANVPMLNGIGFLLLAYLMTRFQGIASKIMPSKGKRA